MKVVVVFNPRKADLRSEIGEPQTWNLWHLAWACWWRMIILGAVLGFIAGLANRIWWTITSPEVSYLLFF